MLRCYPGYQACKYFVTNLWGGNFANFFNSFFCKRLFEIVSVDKLCPRISKLQVLFVMEVVRNVGKIWNTNYWNKFVREKSFLNNKKNNADLKTSTLKCFFASDTNLKSLWLKKNITKDKLNLLFLFVGVFSTSENYFIMHLSEGKWGLAQDCCGHMKNWNPKLKKSLSLAVLASSGGSQ